MVQIHKAAQDNDATSSIVTHVIRSNWQVNYDVSNIVTLYSAIIKLLNCKLSLEFY